MAICVDTSYYATCTQHQVRLPAVTEFPVDHRRNNNVYRPLRGVNAYNI
jgi:hypothetical protein